MPLKSQIEIKLNTRRKRGCTAVYNTAVTPLQGTLHKIGDLFEKLEKLQGWTGKKHQLGKVKKMLKRNRTTL